MVNVTQTLKRVAEHAAYVDANVMGHKRFFTALCGSQNYGLEDAESDVDTKSLMVPTFDSLVFARQRLSKTIEVAPTVEHADVKDMREMFATFLKQNVNFLEILFTMYVDVAPGFELYYDTLFENRELIAHYNPYQALRTMCGMAFEKYHAFDHPYPAAKEKLERYKYDPKQLSHMLRLKEFVVRYLDGAPYEECLRTERSAYLLAVKRGILPLAEAQHLREDTKTWFDHFLANRVRSLPNKSNPVVEELLNDITYSVFTTFYKNHQMIESNT